MVTIFSNISDELIFCLD